MTEEKSRPLALVTGASSGIGLELARQFAVNGHDLVIAADHGDKLARAEADIAADAPEAEITTVVVDLATRQGVETLFETCRATGRPLDVLAANAGAGLAGKFAETNLEEELTSIHLNVVNQVHLIKLLLRQMLAQGGGRVLITASLVALSPGPFMAIYAATKAFLRSFGLAIRNELKDDPVTVTVLMPGATATNFWEHANMEDTSIAQGNQDDPADVAKEAYAALMKDSSQVVTGTANKMRAAAANLTPDTLLAEINRGQGQPPGER